MLLSHQQVRVADRQRHSSGSNFRRFLPPHIRPTSSRIDPTRRSPTAARLAPLRHSELAAHCTLSAAPSVAGVRVARGGLRSHTISSDLIRAYICLPCPTHPPCLHPPVRFVPIPSNPFLTNPMNPIHVVLNKRIDTNPTYSISSNPFESIPS